MADNHSHCWTVYLLECSDSTYYCGVTKKTPEERLDVHNSGIGSKYTRCRLPVKMLASRSNLNKSEAYKLEYAVKRCVKRKKQDFLTTWQPE